MKRRISALFAVAFLASFPLARPLRACGDSLMSWVGAVATGGLSCAIEDAINTVKTLIDNVTRLISTLTHQVSEVVDLARAELGAAANDLRGLASQAEADLNGAAQLAAKVLEDVNRPQLKAISKAAGLEVATKPSVASTPPPGAASTPAGGVNRAAVAGAARSTGPAKAPASLGTATPVSGATAGGIPAAGGFAVAGSATAGSTMPGTAGPGGAVLANIPAEQKDILDAELRAKDAIESLKQKTNNPLNQVRQFANLAEQQVANAVGTALGIAEQALMSPLRALENVLNDLIAHPEKILNPNKIVDDAINQVTNQVNATLNQIFDAVIASARATLNNSNKPLQEALDQAATAKKIADAMQKLEKARTRSTLAGLNAVIPKNPMDTPHLVTHVALATHESGITALDLRRHKAMVAAPYARLDAAKLTARTVGVQMNSKIKGPWQQLQRLKAAPVRLDPSAKTKMDAEIARRFAGKTAAESAAEKRALLTEARAYFAKDPDTLHKVEIIIEGHPVINGRLGGLPAVQ